MRTNILKVGIPTKHIPQIQPAIEKRLTEVGAALIGCQTYADQTLLVLHPRNDTALQFYIDVFSSALQQKQIYSFQVVSCHLFRATFKQDNYPELLDDFPFKEDESWFQAAKSAYTAYLCLKSPHLDQQQLLWLASEVSLLQWTHEP